MYLSFVMAVLLHDILLVDREGWRNASFPSPILMLDVKHGSWDGILQQLHQLLAYFLHSLPVLLLTKQEDNLTLGIRKVFFASDRRGNDGLRSDSPK